MRTNIIVNIQYAGTHFWKDCRIKEVEYLKNIHRHNFYITCKKEVKHDDRDIEIIMFKNEITEYLDCRYDKEFGGLSCESIAKDLLLTFELNYCKVLEDNENGAEIWQK